MSNGVVSSTAPFGFATPIAPAEEVWTTRSTPASSADSKTIREPRRLVSKTASRSALRSEVRPATWKTRSTPSIALRTARRSVTLPIARSNSSPSRAERSELRRVSTRSSSPRAASARARCEPMKPVAPVSNVVAMRSVIVDVDGDRACNR